MALFSFLMTVFSSAPAGRLLPCVPLLVPGLAQGAGQGKAGHFPAAQIDTGETWLAQELLRRARHRAGDWPVISWALTPPDSQSEASIPGSDQSEARDQLRAGTARQPAAGHITSPAQPWLHIDTGYGARDKKLYCKIAIKKWSFCFSYKGSFFWAKSSLTPMTVLYDTLYNYRLDPVKECGAPSVTNSKASPSCQE